MTALLNGLTLGSLMVILTSGLAMMFGLRGVLNVAHGALFMVAAYVGATIATATNYWVALLLVPLGMGLLGVAVELFVLRHLAGRGVLELALITLGLSFVLEYVVITVWGPRDRTSPVPEVMAGSTSVLGSTYPVYRLFVLVSGFVLFAGLMLWLGRSRVGLLIRAVSHDRQTSLVCGVNINRISAIVVAVSFALAGLAGALGGPYLALSPTMGAEIVIPALVIVVVGGLGSVPGAAGAALGFGLLETVGAIFVPSIALLVPYIALIAILCWRPLGFAGTRVH